MTSLKQLAEICGGTLTGPWEGVEVSSAAIGSNAVSYTHLTLPTILRSCRSRWSPYH